MTKKLLLFFMLLAMAIPLWAGEQTVVINRNEGQFEESNGVYYCYKSGLMMTFTSGMNNPNYLVEHQQVYFEVMSVNTSYIIKKIVFHCVDNTRSNNLDCFYWGPTTISIVQNFYNQNAPGTYVASGYTGTWTGETNHIQFTTMAKPVRFGSVEITYEKATGDVFDLVTSDSQLRSGENYVIVNQNYDMAMSTAKTTSFSQETMDAVGVSFVDNTKAKVIINPEVQIFTLRESGETTRPWLLQLTGSNNYLRRNSEKKGTANYNTGYALYYEGLHQTYSPVGIKIGDASGDPYNARIRFKRNAMVNDYTDTCAISYVNSYTYFRTVAYSSWNTYERTQRVYMYMPAQNYEITTECDPTVGGFITLGEGVLELNGRQTSQQFQTVHFFVGTNEGYGVNSVTATDASGNPVAITCTSQGSTGNNYTMVMPASDVHIVATFADPYEIHTNCTPEYGGEFTFNSGAIDVNNQVISNEGKTVTFSVDASLGYVFTGLTCTDDATGNVITLTDNGDGTYSFTMPGNDVTLSATFDRVIGDIFELVTSTDQIVEGNTYIIVSQYHNMVMKHWNKSETTFQGTPVVEWPLGVNDKSKVRVNDNACFFRLDDCTYTADPKCSAYMNTLVGYLGYSGSNLVSTPDNSGYNRARMFISATEYNYLCAFDVIDPSLTNIAIRYEAATNSFKMINYSHSSDERVWLYKLADTYHNISTVCTPPEGGSITNVATSAETGQNVTFTVNTNPGYEFTGVDVTYTDGSQGTITVTDNGNGNFSFTMPDNAVTITANFEAVFNITSTCDPVNGGHVNINNNGAAATSAAQATVNVSVTTEWGYRIASVQAVNTVTGETVELTTVSTSDAGNTYTFTMPAADVRIDAKFRKNLFLLGTAMGRTNWVPAGPEMTFDPENGYYYIDVYFKGVGNDANGYFSFATGIDPAVDWTDNTVTGGDWSQVTGRLAGSSNPTEISATATDVPLQGQNPDNAFKVPAGVYRIMVSEDLTTMSIEQTPLHLYFNPVSGTTVQSGATVTVSSDIDDYVQPIAERYGINEEHQSFWTKTDDQPNLQNSDTVVITKVGETTVDANVSVGLITVEGQAVYYVKAPNVIHTVCNPAPAGYINIDGGNSALEGQTVTFTVGTNVPYSLLDVVLTYVENNVTQTVTLTPNENGIYSFVMPDVEVTVTANYNVLPTHDIYTVIIPDNVATVNGLPDPAQAREGETVTFTVSNSGDVSLTEYTLHSVTLITNETHDTTALTPNGDGSYSFVMPTEDVTIRVYYVREFDVKTLWSPEQGGSVGIATPDGWVTSAQKNNAETVTFKVTPNADYVIKSIRVSTPAVGTIPHVENGNGTYSFEMPQSNVTIIVVFEPVGEYQIYVENDPAEGGSISLSGHVKTDENGYYSDDGHDVVITPTPTSNWQLTGLDVVDSDGNSVGYTDNGDGSYTMLMPASDVTITAHYEESPFRITTYAHSPEGGQIILHGDAADFNEYAGKTVTFTIKENYGYALTDYTFRAYIPLTGANVPVEVTYLGDSTYSFVMPHANVVIDAYFLVGRYLVSTKCVPENGGTIEIIRGLEDNNHVQHGSLVVVKPVPNEGFALDSIYVVNDQTQDTLELSDYGDGTYGFRMPYDNVTVVAVFRTGYNISTRSVPDGVGEFQGLSNAVVLDGRQIQFTVTSTDDNYVLTGITVTNDVTGEEYTVNGDNFNLGIPDFNFVMPAADVTITAYFERAYNITWVVLPNEDAGGVYGYQTFESENYVLEYVDNPFVAQRDVNVGIEEMPGYLFESITVTRDDNQQSIVVTDIDAGVNVNEDDLTPLELRTGWFAKSFEMPASDVTVTVVFKPYTPLKLIENTMYEGCTDGDTVVVSDDLVVVWAAKDYVWAKDLVRSNYAVDLPDEITVYDGTIYRDYVKDDLDFQKHEWDQSNWVILDCSGLYPEITNQVERRKKLDDLVDHKIAGGTIKGVYHIPSYDHGYFERLGKFNHVIKLTEEPRIIPHDNPDIIAGSLGYPGYLPDPKETYAYDYSYNHYVATNFLCYVRDIYSSHYIFSHGPKAEEWMQEQDYNTNLFFLPPQDQEVAHVWAVYAGADTIEEDGTTKLVDNFTVYEYYLNGYVSQNVFDLPGGFQVPAENWTFNRLNCGYTDDSYGRPGSHDNEFTGSTKLMVDSAYMFHVAIKVKPYLEELPEMRAPNVAATAEICDHYDVYPLDVDTHGGTVTGNKAVWDTNTTNREVESVHYFNVMGQQSKTPFDGINIVVTRYTDGSISSEKILR